MIEQCGKQDWLQTVWFLNSKSAWRKNAGYKAQESNYTKKTFNDFSPRVYNPLALNFKLEMDSIIVIERSYLFAGLTLINVVGFFPPAGNEKA